VESIHLFVSYGVARDDQSCGHDQCNLFGGFSCPNCNEIEKGGTYSGSSSMVFAGCRRVYFIGGPVDVLVDWVHYGVYHSPDQEKTIVIEEEAFLLAGYGSVYVKENALFMKNVQGYTTDDGSRPFRNDD
jgi:hypothetical protein